MSQPYLFCSLIFSSRVFHIVQKALIAICIGILLITQAWGKEEYIVFNTIELGSRNVEDAIFSRDNRFIITLARKHTIEIWGAQTGKRIRVISTGKHRAISLVNHPKEKNSIITGGKDHTIQIWDTSRAKSTAVLRGHVSNVYTIAVNVKGDTLVSGSHDGTIIIWDLTKNALKQTIRQAHRGPVNSIDIHPNGKMFASGGKDKKVRLWSLPGGTPVRTLTEHLRDVRKVGFHPEGTLLASSSNDTTLILWNWATGQIMKRLGGHKKAITAFAFHHKGKQLVTGGLDAVVQLWKLPEGTSTDRLKAVDGPVKHLHFDSSGKQIIAAFKRKSVQTWQVGTSSFLGSLKGHTRAIESMDVTNDGRYIISSSLDKTIKVWSVAQKKAERTYPVKSHRIQEIRYSPDDKNFATAGADSVIGLWETKSGNRLASLRKHRGKVNTLSYHPKEPTLVSGGSDQQWILWDLNKKASILVKDAHADQINAIAFSPDGTIFATGSGDRTVKIWSYPKGELKATLKGHRKGIEDVTFSPVDPILASASQDNTVKVWDISSPAAPKLQATMEGHNFIVNRVLFAKDGRAVISVSQDKTVRLWDTKTGNLIRILSGENSPLTTGTISSDGQLIAVGSFANEIILLSYPLNIAKFDRTDKKRRKAQPLAARASLDETSAVEAALPAYEEEEVDTSVLSEEEEESATNASNLQVYAVSAREAEDTTRLYQQAQRDLNQLLKKGKVCQNAANINLKAHLVFERFPDDKAAFHALIKTSILEQDLKLIFLLAYIGQNANFYTSRYDYSSPLDVGNVFDYWIEQVFDQSPKRQGELLTLNFKNCKRKIQEIKVPAISHQLSVPKEFSTKVLSVARFIDFRDFQNLDDQEFSNRFYAEIQRAINNAEPYALERRPLSRNVKSPKTETGILRLNLERMQRWGVPGKVLFQIRASRQPWQSHYTDQDKITLLRLPVGNYYLRIGKHIRRAFVLTPGKTAKIDIDQLR